MLSLSRFLKQTGIKVTSSGVDIFTPGLALELGNLFEDALSKIFRPVLRNFIHRRLVSQDSLRNVATKMRVEGEPVAHFKSASEVTPEKLRGVRICLVGGTDETFSEDGLRSLEGKVVFAQNMDFKSESNAHPLPIGVEDLKWARNGVPTLFRSKYRKARKVDRILVGPFRPTSASRNELMTIAKTVSKCDVVVGRLPALSYAKLASRYRFVACPEGNGLDTHRFWEALYRGSVPVVLNSPFAENWADLGIPIVRLENWADLETLDLDQVENPANISSHWALDLKAWENLIRNSI